MMLIKFLKIFVLIIFLTTISKAEQINVFNFTEDELKSLKVKKVRGADGKTSYTVGSNENGNYLRAEAHNAASGLGKEVKIDLNITPFINITWKVEKDLSGINEASKKGHDFAGRVFVIKKLVLHLYQIEQLIMFFPAITTSITIIQARTLKNQLIMFYQQQKLI